MVIYSRTVSAFYLVLYNLTTIQIQRYGNGIIIFSILSTMFSFRAKVTLKIMI